jgi:hypothetical protein
MLFLVAIFGSVLMALAGPTDQVESIIAIIRHGARREQKQLKDELLSEYPDPNFGIGDLTLTGMRQVYILGKAMVQQYPHLFGKVADAYQVKAHASTYNRTVTSGHCFFSGVYDLGSGLDIESDKKEHYLPPIPTFDPKPFEGKSALPNRASLFPIEVASFPNNILMTPDNGLTCPALSKKRKVLEAEMNKAFTSAFAPLYRKFESLGYHPKIIEKDSFDFLGAYELCDVIVSRAYNDPKFTKYDDNVIEQCIYLTTFYGFKVNSGDHVIAVNQKLNEKVINMLKEVTDDKVKDKQKVYTFFSHDTNLESFWNNFFPEHWHCVIDRYHQKHGDKRTEDRGDRTPWTKGLLTTEGGRDPNECCMELVKFTANIILEIYKSEGVYHVNFKYNNKVVYLPGRTSAIKMTEAIEILQKNTRSDWDQICRPETHKNMPHPGLIVGFGFSAVLALAAIAWLLHILRKRQWRHNMDIVYDAI